MHRLHGRPDWCLIVHGILRHHIGWKVVIHWWIHRGLHVWHGLHVHVSHVHRGGEWHRLLKLRGLCWLIRLWGQVPQWSRAAARWCHKHLDHLEALLAFFRRTCHRNVAKVLAGLAVLGQVHLGTSGLLHVVRHYVVLKACLKFTDMASFLSNDAPNMLVWDGNVVGLIILRSYQIHHQKLRAQTWVTTAGGAGPASPPCSRGVILLLRSA